jgi:hypothetical protein
MYQTRTVDATAWRAYTLGAAGSAGDPLQRLGRASRLWWVRLDGHVVRLPLLGLLACNGGARRLRAAPPGRSRP